MTATTFTQLPGTNRGASAGNWFGRMFELVLAAQERVARRRVAAVLRTYDDETLKFAGFNAKDIKRIRRGEMVTVPST